MSAAAAGPTAHSYGQPLLRARRLPDEQGLLRHRAVYEVSYTPVGAHEPEWIERSTTPRQLLEPYLGVADSRSVLDAADAAWDGRVGRWESLYPGDREVDGPRPTDPPS